MWKIGYDIVDISDNNLQSLFWLGVAHGSDVYAITVLHEQTEKECKEVTGISEKKARNVFDVAGLWTAILRSNDTDGFYKQLALAQEGIESHSKLMIKNKPEYQERLQENWNVYGQEISKLYEAAKRMKNLALEPYEQKSEIKTFFRLFEDEKKEKNLTLEYVKKIEKQNKDRGNLKQYERGEVAVVEGDNGVNFFLLALTDFDNDNKAQSSKESIVECLKKLLDFYNKSGQGFDIYIFH